jgi:hypothetical protein
MNEIINVIPEKYRAYVLALILCIPYLTRAYHSLATGGGLKGIWNAVLFGTNTPASVANIAAAVDKINQQGASQSAAPATTKLNP